MTASGLTKTDVVKGHPNDLKGKNIIVTGGNSGIGLSLSKSLASRGANVLIASRNPEKGNKYVRVLYLASAAPPANTDKQYCTCILRVGNS